MLERLMDYVEKDIPLADIPNFINVLLDIGDELVLASDVKGSADFGNESRVTRIVYHLLKRIDKTARLLLLQTAMSQGSGIGVQRYLLASFVDELTKQAEGGEDSLVDISLVDSLKAIWLQHVRTRSVGKQLLAHGQLSRILSAWHLWGDQAEVRSWCSRVTTSDDGLLLFLPKFCSHTTTQTLGDSAVRIQPRLNPKNLEKYIDTEACANRLTALLKAGQVPEIALESVGQFLKEFEMIKLGKNPDAPYAFDDLE
jgi:predicted KAP-like P-loop ATPase